MNSLTKKLVVLSLVFIVSACKTVTTTQAVSSSEKRVWISSEYIDNENPQDQFIYIPLVPKSI